MSLSNDILQMYREHFHGEPTHMVRAPGRVNLIGEHTDYNDGYVLPMTIERAVYVALAPSPNPDQLHIYAADFDQTATLDIRTPLSRVGGPLEYVKGVTQALLDRVPALVAWQGVVAGDVPIGAGLSSSAALEMAILYAYRAVNGFEMPLTDRAKLGQWVENEWLGVQSGIMDQMAVVYGAAGAATLIDCRTLSTETVTLPGGTAVAILDTGTRRTLDGSAYNTRFEQCAAAAAFFGVPKLRDVDPATFAARSADMDPLLRQRARHVITENARVLAARDAAQNGDAAAFGALMRESHTSMRDDFEISSDALNAMVEQAAAHAACYGARMTGGGFAGCAVALIDADGAADFAASVGPAYAQATGHTPEIYITEATDGAETHTRQV